MNNLKQNLLLTAVVGILLVSAYGTFFQAKTVDKNVLGANGASFDLAYHAGVVHTTSTVGTTAVQVLADKLASLNEYVENISSTVIFCYETATTTGVQANGGIALVQYGNLGNDRSAPYIGGVACVTASGTSTVSVTYK